LDDPELGIICLAHILRRDDIGVLRPGRFQFFPGGRTGRFHLHVGAGVLHDILGIFLSPEDECSAGCQGAAAACLVVRQTSGGLGCPANAVVVGVRTMQIQDPHPSTHVNGTINVVGTASCSVTMNEIYVHVVLQRSDGASWPGTTNDYYNTPQQQANAAAPCSAGPGTFRGYLSCVLRAPAGYNPSYSVNTIYGIWKGVACGLTFAKSGAAAPEPLTVSIPIYKN